jgi:hypothetical protein
MFAWLLTTTVDIAAEARNHDRDVPRGDRHVLLGGCNSGRDLAAADRRHVEDRFVLLRRRRADVERCLHYVTLGSPQRSRAGHVKNAVLVLHGTAGSTKQFLNDVFAGVLFSGGGLLNAAKY